MPIVLGEDLNLCGGKGHATHGSLEISRSCATVIWPVPAHSLCPALLDNAVESVAGAFSFCSSVWEDSAWNLRILVRSGSIVWLWCAHHKESDDSSRQEEQFPLLLQTIAGMLRAHARATLANVSACKLFVITNHSKKKAALRDMSQHFLLRSK